MAAVNAGYRVVGLDTDSRRVEMLTAGRSYVEDISDEVVEFASQTGRYLATSSLGDCKDFDIVVITVPTPLREGAPDLSYIEASGRQLAPLLRSNCTVILESTTYPGTTEELLAPILEEGSDLKAGSDFRLGYSPERIDPGNKVWTLQNTPKVVSGVDDASVSAVKAFYDTIVETTIVVSNTKVAEMTKLIENTFRHVNIAMVNEMAMFAGALGVDIWESISAASTKPFGFMPFRPGPGVGGHCLPVDPSYLSWKVRQTIGGSFRFVELANDVNDHMPDYVVQRIAGNLNTRRTAINGSIIVVIGVSYKPNSGDTRESPGPEVCERLIDLGADVRAIDPFVPEEKFPENVSRVQLNDAELDAAHLIVVLADHESLDWDLVGRTKTAILDTRHRLSVAPNVEYL